MNVSEADMIRWNVTKIMTDEDWQARTAGLWITKI